MALYITSSKKRAVTKLKKLYNTSIVSNIVYDGKNYTIDIITPKQFYKECVALQVNDPRGLDELIATLDTKNEEKLEQIEWLQTTN